MSGNVYSCVKFIMSSAVKETNTLLLIVISF